MESNTNSVFYGVISSWDLGIYNGSPIIQYKIKLKDSVIAILEEPGLNTINNRGMCSCDKTTLESIRINGDLKNANELPVLIKKK